jgi:hypothetical protein
MGVHTTEENKTQIYLSYVIGNDNKDRYL